MTFIIAFKTIKYLRINLAEDAQDLYPEKYLKKKTLLGEMKDLIKQFTRFWDRRAKIKMSPIQK